MPKLTASEREARRTLAIRKVFGGRTQADMADFLSVHDALAGGKVVVWDGGSSHTGPSDP